MVIGCDLPSTMSVSERRARLVSAVRRNLDRECFEPLATYNDLIGQWIWSFCSTTHRFNIERESRSPAIGRRVSVRVVAGDRHPSAKSSRLCLILDSNDFRLASALVSHPIWWFCHWCEDAEVCMSGEVEAKLAPPPPVLVVERRKFLQLHRRQLKFPGG
ncbi:hypothetical protein YC2023_034517 [Brassica napus]